MGTPNRSQLPHVVAKALDKILAIQGATWDVEHENDGTHKSITSSGSVTAAEGGTFGGAGSFDGNVTADADGTPVEIGSSLGTSAGTEGAVGPGLQAAAALTDLDRFALIAQRGSFDELIVLWRTASDAFRPFQIRQESDGFHIMPGPVTNATANRAGYLGSTADSFSAGRWKSVYGQEIDASLGFTERGRSARLGEWTTFTPTRTASAGTWTAGTLSTAAYMLVGKTMTVAFYFTGTSVSNAAVTLAITIPASATAAKAMAGPCIVKDAGGAYATGNWDVQAAGTAITLYNAPGYGTFGIAATNTDTIGVASFEIQ